MTRSAVLPLALFAALSGAPLAQALESGPWADRERADERAGRVEGVILRVDGGRVVIRDDNGREREVRVGNRTHVMFDPSQTEYFPNPNADQLRPGMRVRVNPDNRVGAVLDRIHVLSVPEDLRRASRYANPSYRGQAPADSQELKVRVQEISPGRGELQADVAGRSQNFRVEDRFDLRRYRKGDLVILTVDRSGGVFGIRPATQTGRVMRVGGRSVSVNIDGREEIFTVDDNRLLGGLRPGDTIRFEVEERAGGGRILTAIR